MGSSKGFTRVFAIVLAIVLATVVASAGVAGASTPRAASPEAKEACKKLKKKIKNKEGKAKKKAKAKYKKCLKEYDETHEEDPPPEDPPPEDPPPEDPPPDDPKAAAQALIENHEFYRPFAGTYSSGDELIRFCSGGTYFRRYTSSSDVGVTEYLNNGTWKMNQAAAGTTDEGISGYVATLTITGTWDDSPPVTGNIGIAVSEQTQQSAIDIGPGPKEFVRRDLTGTC